MRRVAYAFIVLMSLANLILGVGLYQPFDAVEFDGIALVVTDAFVVMRSPSGIVVHPSPPFTLPVGGTVHLSCNRGMWIPVLFDCTNTYIQDESPFRGDVL